MGTTAEKLQAIANSKAAIKAAIEAKGVSDVGDVLSQYATKIASIPSGSSSGDPRYEVNSQGQLVKKNFILNFFNDATSISNNGLESAYRDSNVTSASFPNVTSVGNYGLQYAFISCSSLTSVDLSSLTSVGAYGLQNAFSSCSSLTSVDLSSLTSVGAYGLQYAFSSCSSLTSVDLSSLTSVGAYGLYNAFNNCTSLVSLNMPNLTSVGTNGMRDMHYQTAATTSSLKSVSFPKLETISDYGLYRTFANNNGITSIDIHSVTSVGDSGMYYAFAGCQIEEMDLSNLTTITGTNAISGTWENCTSLKKCYLTKIGGGRLFRTFNGCSSLELVDMSEATAIPTMGNVNAFQNTNETFKVVVPDALYDQWIVEANWSTYASHIVKASEYTPAS